MKFDATRMAKLAGIAGQENSNMLTEAGNRSMHDDPGVQDDADHRYGKGQLAEGEHEDPEEGMHPSMEEGEHEDADEGMRYEMDYAEEGAHVEEADEAHCMEEDPDEDIEELHPALAAAGAAGLTGLATGAGEELGRKMVREEADVVYDIDEDMLREELIRMRQERADRLNETKVRDLVREEIADMLNEMSEEDLNSDSSWLYGDNKPTRSKKGSVAVGALGIGFE